MLRALALALLLALPMALAQPSGAIDVTITLGPHGIPRVDPPAGPARIEDVREGERYAFNLSLARDYTTLEVRAEGLGLERARQLVPSLVVPEDEYPLFEVFPHERIWEVDGPANVFFVNGTGNDITLRLGVAGPRNVTLVLAVDARPPNFTLRGPTEVTHLGFYEETTTDEFALATLLVREVGATEWIENPTPIYHVLQRFPVQGLDPETEHEVEIRFTDWAGNTASAPPFRVTTLPRPVVPLPRVTALSPEPNATVVAGGVVVRARIESPDSPVIRENVRFFFDKREVSDRTEVGGGLVTFTPPALGVGKHSVSVEVTNEAGGKGEARWSFEVAGAQSEPGPTAALTAIALALAVALSLARDRSRKS